MAPPHAPKVDLVIVFRSATSSSSGRYVTKQQIREEADSASKEYERLLSSLRDAGLKATGRRGQKTGQILVLVWCPLPKLVRMVQRERHSDFLRGLPASELTALSTDALVNPASLSPADRLRLVYEYITSTKADGGLGIIPESKDWTRVESLVALHDHEFNEMWIHAWTRRQIGFGIGLGELDKLKEQFGESIALYFAFLSTYAQSLIYIAAFGVVFFTLKLPYSPIYSVFLVVWSIVFVEYWRVRERRLSVRWGTRGSFRVERRRAQYEDVWGSTKFPWWKRDLRIATSLPVIFVFALLLAGLLTALFIFEAFVMSLYTGPGQAYVSFAPTVLFVASVPRLLAVYQDFAVRLTNWECHAHQSAHEGSLTLKTFSLSSLVSYLGLGLSAFVYVPFGEFIMARVQESLSVTSSFVGSQVAKVGLLNATTYSEKGMTSFWASGARRTNPTRLQGQMFAYTVTNQVINNFLEIGLPFITRGLDVLFSRSKKSGSSSKSGGSNQPPTSSSFSTKKNGKRVVFEDEEAGEKEEREFLTHVRHQVSLPEYTLFSDYSEMVTQFGYVALWSTIWPLASLMALLNNWIELRSDAFKIVTHCRRPFPNRTDTIGPWLNSLTFITWLSVLTNSALVYLFRPTEVEKELGTVIDTSHVHTHIPLDVPAVQSAATPPAYTELIIPAALIALSASHGFFLLRLLIRHVIERLCWRGCPEETRAEEAEQKVKQQYLQSLGLDNEGDAIEKAAEKENLEGMDGTGFWTRDEGIDEIQKAVKDS